MVFLLLQLFLILEARFIPERFFCWAPYDEHTYYEISVSINDQAISSNEIQDRYRVFAKGWEPRSIHNIFSIVEQYEATYGNNEKAEVTIWYSTNGHENRLWTLKS